MKRFVIFLFVLMAVAGYSQEVSLIEARKLYFSMSTDKTASLRLFIRLQTGKERFTPVLLAYRGASSAASAGIVNGVNKKFSYFKQGQADLEQAIYLDPKNPEIRFLRLATQTNVPVFLFYKSDIREDKKMVLEKLAGLLADESERSMALDMARSLLKFDSLTSSEKEKINQLSKRYEQNN